MPDIFDEVYAEKKKDIFDQVASEKKATQGESNAATIFGREFSAGVPGGFGDILNLLKASGLSGLAGQAAPEASGIHEFSEAIREKTGGALPQTPMQRFGESAGRFSGQEAGLGAVLGGVGGVPGAATGAGFGALHGAYAGTIYQIAKEFGADDNTALWITLGATLSPVALERLSPSIYNAMKKRAPELLQEQAGKKPPSPPGSPPSPPSEIEKLGQQLSPENLPKSAFETAEKAIEETKPKVDGKPLGVEVKFEEPVEPKSLQGRVQKEQDLGSAVSKEKFSSLAEGGRETEKYVKELSQKEKEPVTEAYKKAREVTESHNDTYAKQAKKNEELISELENIEKRNPAQQGVLDYAYAIRNLIGDENGLIQQNAQRLIAQADTIASVANYDLPFVGYKGKLKSMVHNLNEAVIESLERAGLDANAVRNADKMYGRWADRFKSDEITPFLEKNVRNPEELLRRAVKNEGTYRAVKEAIGSRNHPLINKIDREVVDARMGDYYKNPEKVTHEANSQYQRDLSNLQQLIGKEKAGEVDAILRKKRALYEKHRKSREQISEREKQFIEGRPRTVKSQTLENLAEKVGKHANLKPEDILKKLNSRSGIKELRKSIPEETFNKLTKQKIRRILEDNPELKAKDLYKTLSKEDNYEIFSEILGSEETEALYQAAKTASEQMGSKILKSELIQTLVEKGAIQPIIGRKAVAIIKILKALLIA